MFLSEWGLQATAILGALVLKKSLCIISTYMTHF